MKSKKQSDEENQKRLADSEKNRDEKNKKEFIADIEMELTKENISDERLSKRVGLSDWREKIRGAADFHGALSMKSHLWDIVRKLKYEYTCASCGTKKEEFTVYEKAGKKYCSYECNKGGNNGKIDANDIGKIVKAFQNWMKNNKIESVSYSSNGELVIKFEGKGEKTVKKESEMTTKEKEIKNFLSSSSQKEISVGREFKDNSSSPNKKGNNNNTGLILGSLAIVGIIGIIIAVVVSKNKKRD